jgi:hypothetical protein
MKKTGSNECMTMGAIFDTMKHMKRRMRNIVAGSLIGIATSFFVLGIFVSMAQETILPDVPTTPDVAPAASAKPNTENALFTPRYLPNIIQGAKGPADMVFFFYKYLMGLVGIVAVGVIIYAGVLRTVSADVSKIKQANAYIMAALKGIVLLFGAQVLFNTINPNIVDFPRIQEAIRPKEKFTPKEFSWVDVLLPKDATSTSIYGSTAGHITGSSLACYGHNLADCSVADIRSELTSSVLSTGIVLKPECTPGGSTVGCISFQGVQQETLDAMVAMGKAGIPMSITSVTEGAHAGGAYSHANGYKWDMSPVSESQFADRPAQFEKIATRSDSSATYRDKVTGAICSLETAAPKHWDCSVK